MTLPNCRPFNGIRVHENQDDMRSAREKTSHRAVRAGVRLESAAQQRRERQYRASKTCSLAMEIFLVLAVDMHEPWNAVT